MSVKLDGPRPLKVTYRSEGKIRRENTFDLSADGKTNQGNGCHARSVSIDNGDSFR
jgi:hypothetical protein